MSKLIIVESPTKAKHIQSMLGSDYLVKASLGHIMDLPAKELGVDVENSFKPTYVTIPGKNDVMKKLKDTARKADEIYLATDPDREGEAIAWNLQVLVGKSSKPIHRVEFKEITKKGIADGLNKPRKIDVNLVNAQQGRRVLDRLVGYKISPVLWKKLNIKGLSAGRVQSVALKIICDREEVIQSFKPDEYWTITGVFRTADGNEFTSKLIEYNGKKPEIKNRLEAERIVSDLKGKTFAVASITRKPVKKSPPAPFTTSTLQQEANKRLGFDAELTMNIAQELFEGPGAIGHGLITYMRTDSVRISDESQAQAFAYILENFGTKYAIEKAREFTNKNVSQDAHEAIRPVDVYKTPAMLKTFLTEKQYKLYKLIYERFLASQMADAIYDKTEVLVSGENSIFKISGQTLKFNGYQITYAPVEDNGDEDEEMKTIIIPLSLKESDNLDVAELNTKQHFTKPPKLFTQAALVEILEKHGIGRPSTYAAIFTTLFKRKYIEHKKKYLVSTELGRLINQKMKEFFSTFVDTKFTAEMEAQLDLVAEGKMNWVSVVDNLYKVLKENLVSAQNNMEAETIKQPDKEAVGICPECGNEVTKNSKGWGCSGYREGCKVFIQINALEKLGFKSLPESVVKKLLKGERVKIQGLVSKDGKKYAAFFVFSKNENGYYNVKMDGFK